MSEVRFTTLRRGSRDQAARPILRLARLAVKVGIRRVIAGLDLELFEGDALLVSGPNGSGKSTLLNAIAGLEPARIEQGTIHLGEDEITHLPAHGRARRGLAFLRQRDNVFADLTVDENLRLALGNDGPDRFSAACPGWRADLRGHKRVALLSGGQKQRLAWAMATLRPSRLLLADEPDAGMFQRLKLPTSGTLLLVTHNLEFGKVEST